MMSVCIRMVFGRFAFHAFLFDIPGLVLPSFAIARPGSLSALKKVSGLGFMLCAALVIKVCLGGALYRC
jgi:hypothetical protein